MKFNDQPILQIKNIDDVTIIDWVLGNFCNFKCSYCFKDSNTGTFRVPLLNNTIKKNINHLINELKENQKNNIHFMLSGGEPTLYHDFKDLSTFLKQYGSIGIVTNGSRTINWWEENNKVLDQVVLSYHSEFSNVNHILNVVNLLSKNNIDIGVHVMMNPELFDKCVQDINFFKEKFDGLSVNIFLKLLRDTNGYSIAYTDEQKKYINGFHTDRKNKLSKVIKHRPNLVLNNKIMELEPKHIVNFNGSFKGYECFAHQEFIQINRFGYIGKMSCNQQFSKLSNIYNEKFVEDFKIPKKSIICDRHVCGCIGLLYCSKNHSSQ